MSRGPASIATSASGLRRLLGGAVLLVALAPLPHAAIAREVPPAACSGDAVVAPEARGIPRFAEIEPGLARGGQPSEDGLAFLRERGTRTVISFRKNPGERRRLERMGIAYVEIPLHAGLFRATPPTDEQVRQFLEVVRDSSRRPVFVHCRHGKDRTGAMVALYRIEACGWTAEEAVAEMRAFGFSKHYRKLMRFVQRFRASTQNPPRLNRAS